MDILGVILVSLLATLIALTFALATVGVFYELKSTRKRGLRPEREIVS